MCGPTVKRPYFRSQIYDHLRDHSFIGQGRKKTFSPRSATTMNKTRIQRNRGYRLHHHNASLTEADQETVCGKNDEGLKAQPGPLAGARVRRAKSPEN